MRKLFDYIYYNSFKNLGLDSQDCIGHNNSFKIVMALKYFLILDFLFFVGAFNIRFDVFLKSNIMAIVVVVFFILEIIEYPDTREKNILLFEQRYRHLNKRTRVIDLAIIYILLTLAILTPVFVYVIEQSL
ncbi:MAG: hypothetical protein AAB681_01885 [Patescibacteria group bacterium]